MTRDELRDFIKEQLTKILAKFDTKNESYGYDDDAFYNFRETARRMFKSDDLKKQFLVLLIYMDKHLVALANHGLGEKEADDRLEDIIIYATIAGAMWYEEARKKLSLKSGQMPASTI